MSATRQRYVVCPACFRSGHLQKLVERDGQYAGSFWDLVVQRGKGAPTKQETAAARAKGLKTAPGHGFSNKKEYDVQPDPNVLRELRKRCKAFLRKTNPENT